MATHSSVLAWRIPGTGAWWAAVYGVTQSRTQLKRLSSNSILQFPTLEQSFSVNFPQKNLLDTLFFVRYIKYNEPFLKGAHSNEIH